MASGASDNNFVVVGMGVKPDGSVSSLLIEHATGYLLTSTSFVSDVTPATVSINNDQNYVPVSSAVNLSNLPAPLLIDSRNGNLWVSGP